VFRRVAGWRQIGHYPGTSSYSAGEMAVSIFAGSAQHLPRPVFDTGGGPFYGVVAGQTIKTMGKLKLAQAAAKPGALASAAPA